MYKVAINSLKRSNSDLVIANDKQEMQARGEHIARLIDFASVKTAIGKKDIAQKLIERIKDHFNE